MKRFMTLLLAMLMVLSLAACGDKPSATVDAEGLGKALTERVQFDSTMSAIDAGDYLELPEGSSAAAYMSDGSTMEEIFVVSCKDKTDASAVKIAMQELLDRRDMALNPQLTVFEDIVKREPYSVEEKAEEIVQRVKLADKLEERGQIFILDEPTDGLHLDDIRRLMKLFNKMTDQGNTLFIIEHSLDVMKDADYIVELGPEGGQAGGEILFTGTPKEMLESSGSVTREYLSD